MKTLAFAQDAARYRPSFASSPARGKVRTQRRSHARRAGPGRRAQPIAGRCPIPGRLAARLGRHPKRRPKLHTCIFLAREGEAGLHPCHLTPQIKWREYRPPRCHSCTIASCDVPELRRDFSNSIVIHGLAENAHQST